MLGFGRAALLFGGPGQDGAGGVHLHDGKLPNDYASFAGQDRARRQQDVLRLRPVSAEVQGRKKCSGEVAVACGVSVLTRLASVFFAAFFCR